MFRWVVRPLVRAVIWCTNFVTIEGKENIPKEGAFLICSNHRSLIDPFCVGAAMKRLPYFMAKDELFHKPVIGSAIHYCHAFPVKRGERDLASVQQAVNYLKQGSPLLVFPEGTRSKTGVPLPPKTGVALLAGRTGCDVLPVAICFEGKYRFWKPIKLRIGKVIPNEALNLQEGKRSVAYARASEQIMQAIVQMLPLSQQKGEPN